MLQLESKKAEKIKQILTGLRLKIEILYRGFKRKKSSDVGTQTFGVIFSGELRCM